MRTKKIVAVALVALLAFASVFAASSFKGKVRTRLGLNNYAGSGPEFQDNVVFGLLDKTAIDGVFMLQEMTKTAQGKGDGPYAEVDAYANIRLKFINYANREDKAKYNDPTADKFDGQFYNYWQSANLQYKIGFNKANLVLDKDNNFKISIIGKSPMNNYARGWEKDENDVVIGSTPFVTTSTAFYKKYIGGDDVSHEDYSRPTGGYVPNIGITYDKYSFVLGLDGGYGGRNTYIDHKGAKASKDAIDYLVFASADGVKLSDEMQFSAAAGLFNSNRMVSNLASIGKQTHVLYGGQFKYKTDSLSIDVGATGNIAVNSDWQKYTDVDERNAIEASVNVAYKGDISASIDAWFLDNQALWSDDDCPDYVTFDNTANLGYVYRSRNGEIFQDSTESNKGSSANNRTLHKALSAQITVNPVKNVGVTLTAQDILNQGIYGIKAPISLDKSFTITPAFEYTIDTNKLYAQNGKLGQWSNPNQDNVNGIWEGRIEANYRQDKYSIFGSVRIGKEALADSIYINPYLNIQSRTLINGARLSFVWTKGNFGGATSSPSGKYHNGNGFGDVYIEARIDFK